MNASLSNKKVIVNVVKLKTLVWGDCLGLSKWALDANTCIPVTGRFDDTYTHRRGPHEGGGRDRSDVATSQGMQGATKAGRGGKESPLKAPEEVWSSNTLIWTSTPRTRRE